MVTVSDGRSPGR